MAAVLARSAVVLAESLKMKALPCLSVASRGMAIDKAMQDREHAAENLYFSKQEEKLLRNMLKKMKSQADQHDRDAGEVNTHDDSELEAITKKYNISPQDLEAIKKWKHN